MGLTEQVADCTMNLGAVYQGMGRYQDAETAHTAAREVYQQLGLTEQVADCTMTLGIVYQGVGRYQDAVTAYTAAREVYQQLGLTEKVATCTMNLGNVYRAMGRYQDAETAFTSARAAFELLGLVLEVARCDHSRAVLLAAEGNPGRDVRAALTVLVPSVRVRDSVRFQFPKASDRLAWAASIADGLDLAFWLAHEVGDAELIADLIETQINHGIYTTNGPENDGQGGAAAVGTGDTVGSLTNRQQLSASALDHFLFQAAHEGSAPSPVQGGPGDGGPSATMSGLVTLLDTTVLPLGPPPQLLRPATTGAPRTVLDRHLPPSTHAGTYLSAIPAARVEAEGDQMLWTW